MLRLTEGQYAALRKAKRVMAVNAGTRWEIEFARQLDGAGVKGYLREYRFMLSRRFRFDFAFPQATCAVEIDGAVHRIKSRFRSDREKHQLALLRGWRVLRVGPDQVRSGEALKLAQELLGRL